MSVPVPILAFDEIDSTNAEARRRAEAGEGGPLWITARRQTAGRGRRGRAWSTETGNLAATLLTTTAKSPAEAAQVTFVAALAIADLYDAYVPPSLVSIKWPNDVLIDGLKASGILVESGARPDGLLWLAVGCGVNLNHAPEGTERPATRIADHLRGDVLAPPTPEQAVAVLGEAFARRFDDWERLGFAATAAAWTARAQGLGQSCIARLHAETVEGVAEGLEADGALRLRLPNGAVRRITAGDVFFAPA
ncbi:MAG: biotin--[acetyl-CoA-carboxylase] ligase [Proteobacteria bacterium]|nr:biotin--[acetyl-CoA-carboxylase] ligase [Pseudomonadota bacterium]